MSTYYFISKFGAIKLNPIITTIGRKNGHIKLHSLGCSDRHASVIIKPDRSVKLINHSRSNCVFVNDHELVPGQSIVLTPGDVINFSGDEPFKFVDSVDTIDLCSRSLSPD